MTVAKPIRIAIVHDRALCGEALMRALSIESDLSVVARCGAAEEARETIARQRADVAIVSADFSSGGCDALLDALRTTSRATRVLILTSRISEAKARSLIARGISGIVLMDRPLEALLEGIRTLAGNGSCFDTRIVRLLSGAPARDVRCWGENVLSEVEDQVLRLVVRGLSNKAIAGELGATESAVKGTIQRLFRKTGVQTRSQLVRFALEGSGDESSAAGGIGS